MIGLLNGVVELFDGQAVILEVGGVGYKVLAPSNLLSKIKTGDKVKLFTHTHVREDLLELYGFLEAADLKLFQNLINVSGVGPKTALGIFSSGSRSDIINAIVKGDVSFFTLVPRLGKKNAQKIIIELKGKLGSSGSFDLSDVDTKENDEVIAVLKSFGFTPSEIQKTLKEIGGQANTSEEKIKMALKYLGK